MTAPSYSERRSDPGEMDGPWAGRRASREEPEVVVPKAQPHRNPDLDGEEGLGQQRR